MFTQAIVDGVFYVGTERLGRALTDAERRALEELLRRNDFAGARLVATAFMLKRTGDRDLARDLVGRASLRLVRSGWHAGVVTLVKVMCRFAWCEYCDMRREDRTRRRAEQAFVREQAIHGEQAPPAAAAGDPLGRSKDPVQVAPSAEVFALRVEDEAAEQAQLERRRADLAWLRAYFAERKDEVNVAYLDLYLEGVEEPAAMAERTGRPVADFYAAQKRRIRAVRIMMGVEPANEGK